MGTHVHILCMQTDWPYHLLCVTFELDLYSSWFGWCMSSHAQHVSRIRSQPLMPARLYQISLSFYLSLLPFSIPPPPLFIHTGMCDMWISRQGVWYPCWALERWPNMEEVVKNNPAATSIHAPFIASLSDPAASLCYLLLWQVLHMVYLPGSLITLVRHLDFVFGFIYYLWITLPEPVLSPGNVDLLHVIHPWNQFKIEKCCVFDL